MQKKNPAPPEFHDCVDCPECSDRVDCPDCPDWPPVHAHTIHAGRYWKPNDDGLET